MTPACAALTLPVKPRPDTTQERNCRIEGIWWFVVKQVHQFTKTLRPRERANYDHDDILMALWVHLAEKDHLWNRQISRYITFAGLVVKHELEELRNRSRIVHSPRNATCRLKQYDQDEAAGTLSPRGQATADAIRRTQLAVAPIYNGSNSNTQSIAVECDLEKQLLLDQVRETMIDLLTMPQLTVLSLYLGLHGKRKQSISTIAQRLRLPESRVVAIKNESLARIRAALGSDQGDD